MRQFFLLLILFFSVVANSQKLLKGVVLDAEKNKPIANASIFLNNTSIGTKADEQGNFSLNIPNGKFDLIVSSVGYETFNQTINTNELSDFLTIKIKIKTEVLQEVIVEPYEKDGWEKWGKFFLDNFIGTSAYARECRIKNTGVIHFRNSKKNNELTAVADEPLVIENKALGYTIQYQLETFTYNFKDHYLLYTGYPFFQPMSGNPTKQKRWEKKRDEIYYGSMMHFMRSIYRNKIVEEGFEVRGLKKILNTGTQSAQQLTTSNLHNTAVPETIETTQSNNDTENYDDQILNPDNYKDVIGLPLTGDSIAYAVNPTTAGLDFTHFLLVIFKNKIAPLEYRQQFPRSSEAMMSQIVLINHKPIEIEANGSYYNPVDLMSTGYWAWSEKIAMMLPFDYVPSKE